MELVEKVRKWIVNTILLFICAGLFLVVLILCNKYDATHFNAEIAKYDREAAMYRAQTESVKMQTAKIYLEAEEARLKAFIKAFSNGTYPNGEVKE